MTVPIDLSGHHAVVTGTGKGIGRAIALELAAAGAGIFAVSRTEADLKRLGVDGEALGKPYGYGVVDLRGKAGADCIAAAALVSLGQVDILVNNAGVSDNAPVLEVSEAQWDATMHINARGAFFLAQVLGRHMVKQGWGRTTCRPRPASWRWRGTPPTAPARRPWTTPPGCWPWSWARTASP